MHGFCLSCHYVLASDERSHIEMFSRSFACEMYSNVRRFQWFSSMSKWMEKIRFEMLWWQKIVRILEREVR